MKNFSGPRGSSKVPSVSGVHLSPVPASRPVASIGAMATPKETFIPKAPPSFERQAVQASGIEKPRSVFRPIRIDAPMKPGHWSGKNGN